MPYLPKDHLEKHYISIEDKDYLLKFLLDSFDLDFSDYSEASVRRRFTKMLNDFGVKTIQELCKVLSLKPDGKDLFLSAFTVNVTEMFRDPSFYEHLRFNVLPKLKHLNEINIWSAGCSSGEEVLSLAIVLHEEGLLHKTRILGSDISLKVLNSARKNSYKARNLKAYKKAYLQAGGEGDLENYIITSGDNIAFENFLTQKVSYRQLNLLDTMFYNRFDLIVCRNVLIYFKAALQDKVIDHFHKALTSNGYLGLGSKESILFYQNRDWFQELDIENKIYRKIK